MRGMHTISIIVINIILIENAHLRRIYNNDAMNSTINEINENIKNTNLKKSSTIPKYITDIIENYKIRNEKENLLPIDLFRILMRYKNEAEHEGKVMKNNINKENLVINTRVKRDEENADIELKKINANLNIIDKNEQANEIIRKFFAFLPKNDDYYDYDDTSDNEDNNDTNDDKNEDNDYTYEDLDDSRENPEDINFDDKQDSVDSRIIYPADRLNSGTDNSHVEILSDHDNDFYTMNQHGGYYDSYKIGDSSFSSHSYENFESDKYNAKNITVSSTLTFPSIHPGDELFRGPPLPVQEKIRQKIGPSREELIRRRQEFRQKERQEIRQNERKNSPLQPLNYNHGSDSYFNQNTEGYGGYSFGYRVQNRETNHGHRETKNGNRVEGEYHVDLPNGLRQIVTYYADETGYHPTIRYEPIQPEVEPRYMQTSALKLAPRTIALPPSTSYGVPHRHPSNEEPDIDPRKIIEKQNINHSKNEEQTVFTDNVETTFSDANTETTYVSDDAIIFPTSKAFTEIFEEPNTFSFLKEDPVLKKKQIMNTEAFGLKDARRPTVPSSYLSYETEKPFQTETPSFLSSDLTTVDVIPQSNPILKKIQAMLNTRKEDKSLGSNGDSNFGPLKRKRDTVSSEKSENSKTCFTHLENRSSTETRKDEEKIILDKLKEMIKNL